jgi:hypothetical protein
MTATTNWRQMEDDLYRQVLKGNYIGTLARERGLSRPAAYRMVERAAERESWRIAGLEPPRPGAVIYTLGKGGVLRAVEYDANGDGHPVDVRALGGSEVGYSRTSIDDTAPALRSREYPTYSALPKGSAQQAELRRCDVCEDPIPKDRRAGSPTCSDRCMNARKRELNGDPTVKATIRWLREPPTCKGCGKSLRAKRVGTTYHNARCRLRAERLNPTRAA